jgi:hypothetical protein
LERKHLKALYFRERPSKRKSMMSGFSHTVLTLIAKRVRMTLRVFVEEWKAKYLPRVRASTAKRYRELLTHQLLPHFGNRALSAITLSAVEAPSKRPSHPGR